MLGDANTSNKDIQKVSMIIWIDWRRDRRETINLSVNDEGSSIDPRASSCYSKDSIRIYVFFDRGGVSGTFGGAHPWAGNDQSVRISGNIE